MSSSVVDAGRSGGPSSTARDADSDISTQPSGGGTNLPPPNVSIWASWVLGSVLWFAVPLYKRILRVEGEVEKTVETAAGVAEEAAEVAKKVAIVVAEALPDGSGLKKVVLKVEEIADMVIIDVERTEAFIHKVDEIKEEVEEVVEAIIKEAESSEKEAK